MQYVDLTPVVAVVLLAVVAAVTAYPVARAAHGQAAACRLAGSILLVGAVVTTAVVTLGPTTEVGASPVAGRAVNLVPFVDIRAALESANHELAALNLFGNACLFAPVGFVGTLRSGRPLWAAFLGCALSVLEEAAQYLIGRSADVDDVLLNGAGLLLGVLAAIVVQRVLRRNSVQRPTGDAVDERRHPGRMR